MQRHALPGVAGRQVSGVNGGQRGCQADGEQQGHAAGLVKNLALSCPLECAIVSPASETTRLTAVAIRDGSRQ
jgi:hypothetical protein